MNYLKIHASVIYIFLLNICFTQECPPADTLVVTPYQNSWNIPYNNTWEGIEIMTWNLKEFPLSGNTVEDVQEIISDILPDIIGFQELSTSAYNTLSTMIPAYTFIKTNYSEGFNSNLQLGIAYRSDCVEISSYSTLFDNNSYPFAHRPPLKADFVWSCGETSKPFQIINLHFKCCDDGFERRLEASEILLSYLEDEIEENNLVNIVVIGDFNDSLDDPQNNNSLWPLVQSNDLYFVDSDIANGQSQNWSYPSWPSHVDHILINENLFDEYDDSNVSTIKVDNYTGYNYFQNNISDHRPVLWEFIINEQTLLPDLVINEIMNNPSIVSDSNGEWFEILNNTNQTIDLYGLLIIDNDSDQHMIDEHILVEQNDFVVLGSLQDINLNGGIIVDYEYSDFNLSNLFDEIIIIDQNQNIIDEVYYDYGENFPNNEGSSMSLINPNLDNNLGNSWVQSESMMQSGDFGTPGSNNNSCQSNGDSNLDNIINIVDIVFTVGYILGEQEFNADNLCEADMDQNGIVNVVDIVSAIGYILEGN